MAIVQLGRGATPRRCRAATNLTFREYRSCTFRTSVSTKLECFLYNYRIPARFVLRVFSEIHYAISPHGGNSMRVSRAIFRKSIIPKYPVVAKLTTIWRRKFIYRNRPYVARAGKREIVRCRLVPLAEKPHMFTRDYPNSPLAPVKYIWIIAVR